MRIQKLISRITYSFLIICLFCFYSYGQEQNIFPKGITIDPGIEKICKAKKKELNIIKMVQFDNDSIPGDTFLSAVFQSPIQSMVFINGVDTLLTFINALIPVGFQIQMTNDTSIVEAFIGSKSCKCYKNNLSDSVLQYGAGYKPNELTLVLSKRYDLKKGDRIYGYIKTSGGHLYYSPGENENYVRQRFDFDGFFEIEFNP